jgi:hypothetical protein
MPLGWRLMALVRHTDSDVRLATAAGPLDGQTVHGRGTQPDQALRQLAGELRRDSRPPDGVGRSVFRLNDIWRWHALSIYYVKPCRRFTL